MSFDLDLTAWTLLTAIGLTATYLGVRRYREGPLDRTAAFSGGITVFLSALAIPTAVQLIVAGLKGKAADLPTNWRGYVALVGVIALYFTADKLWSTFRAALDSPRNVPSEAAAPKMAADDQRPS